VTEYPRIRFYAAVPLVNTDGHALGALCVIDQRPKCLLAGQRTALRHLAEVVMGLFEARKAGAPQLGSDGSGAIELVPTPAQLAGVGAVDDRSYQRAGNSASPQEQKDRKRNASESRCRPRRAAA
jgi:GAF domain-containing protein